MLTYYMVAPVIAKYALEQGVIVALSGLAATAFVAAALLDIVGESGLFWAILPIDAMATAVFVCLALRK